MLNRSFSVAVVVFWISTMTWLVKERVLPPLLVGEPPNFLSVVEELDAQNDARSTWQIRLNDEPMGRAETWMDRLDDGISHLHSNVHLEWSGGNERPTSGLALIDQILPVRGSSFELTARSRFEIDPLGRLVVFSTSLGFGDLEDAVRLRGTVEGNELRLRFSSGGFVHETNTYLASDALVGDGFSPRDRLPGLRVGQKWTVPIYSPFRPRTDPMEILEAEVERRESIEWNGRRHRAMLVVYRRDAGAGLRDADEPAGKMWVLEDGLVVRQEAMLMGSWLQFVRESNSHDPGEGKPTGLHDSSRQ